MKSTISLLFLLTFAQISTGAECICQCTCGASEQTETVREVADGDLIRLKATGGVSFVVVKAGTEELFKGTIHDGREVELNHLGKLDVLMTAPEHITVEINGETLKPNAKGTAKISLTTQDSSKSN